MGEIEKIKKNTSICKTSIREGIMSLEEDIRKQEGAFIGDSDICPLKHSFTDGIYVREIFVPAGMVLVGKIHKHEHPNFLLSGEADMVTEDGGRVRVKGPCAMISPSGTKRALVSVTDLVWITVHHNPTNTQDLKELEEIIIADSYAKYDKYKKVSERKIVTLWNKIIKKLTICRG